MHSERITYLTNADQKAALEAFARARGDSVGSVLREAVSEYMARPLAADEEELAALTAEVNAAIPRMAATLDRMSAKLQSVHEEVDLFLREKGVRP